jgi:uncharacterized membrane protein YozB (DUF420 family)
VPLGPLVILILKIAVGAVSLLLLAALIALLKGNVRLHGRINMVFFALTMTTVIGFELLVRFIRPELFDYVKGNQALRQALNVHLCFSIPSAILMPFMLYTGLTHRRTIHLRLAIVFGILWIGTFVTGIFFLPVNPPSE